jgi:gamma-glutamyltranspeptidase / glutathione hydrolase
MSEGLGEGFRETWSISKPAVVGRNGVVTSQHYLSSQVGARVLEAGGNAVDAAVATALHLGTVEPWMSGLGGGGVMMVYVASERKTYAVDFTMVAPEGLDPAAYPLLDGDGGDLFAWPAVKESRNVHGPLSFAVPGNAAGLSTALERFGTTSFAEAITPAVEQAREGMPADWYSTLKIASSAPVLCKFAQSARTYLPGGHVPCGEWGGPLPRLQLGELTTTLERLRIAGARDFYEGKIATEILTDMDELGAPFSAADFANYQPSVVEVPATPYRNHHIYAAPGLTAGPTMRRALAKLAREMLPGAAPDASTYLRYADALNESYEHRLRTLGDTDEGRAETCTTHLSVADSAGNVVALTQTLLSIFGSKVMLPRTGLMWNNGIMWFDPRPGQPNSIAPGKRPLCNMCPTIVERADGARFALGASGGRRIFPAVFQLSSFLTDFGMDLDCAFHTGRVDVSATQQVSVDRRLSKDIIDAMSAHHGARAETHGVYPALFACPNGAGSLPDGTQTGAAFVTSPWSQAVAAES